MAAPGVASGFGRTPGPQELREGLPIPAPEPAIRQILPRAKSGRRSEAQRGKPVSGLEALCNILFTQSSAIAGLWRDPRVPRGYFLLEVAAHSISDFRGVISADKHGPMDGVLPRSLPLGPARRLLINPLAPWGPDTTCSKPGRNEFAPPTSARPATYLGHPPPRAFSNPFPSSLGSRGLIRARLPVTLNSTFSASFLVSASRAARRYDAADSLALSIVDTPVPRCARPLSIPGLVDSFELVSLLRCLLATAAGELVQDLNLLPA